MTAPDPNRSHVVMCYRDRDGQRWWHMRCTCGATYGSPSEEDRDEQAAPHRAAGEQFRQGTVTA